jgi:pimeloyl-ACP methyl ester carboxylesterase
LVSWLFPLSAKIERDEMNWIEVNNGATRFVLDGNGSAPLVLIHEMGGSLESWEPLLPVIQKDRTVLRYDMRGFGQASKLRGTASIDTLTNDLAALLDVVAFAGPVDLCGMAVGGAVTLHLAARHPHRVRRLALMGPALGVDPAKRSDVHKRADALEANGMSSIVDSELGLTYPDSLRNADAFATYRARWLGNDAASYAATYRMLAALDAGPALASVRSPTLVLAGAYDPLRPPELMSQVAERIAGARFEIVPSGHVMSYQTPDAVGQKLHAFWEAA